VLNPKALTTTGYYYIKGTSPTLPCTTVRAVYVVVAPLINVTDKVLKNCPPLNLYSALTTNTDNGGIATYHFYTDAALSTPVRNATIITESGTFYYNAENSYGCFGNSAKIEVTAYPIPYFTVQKPDTVVYPRTVNLIFTHPPLTFAEFTYWKDAELTIPLDNYQTIGESGTYYIKAVSFGGCVQSNPVSVVIKPPPEPDLIAPNTFTPNGDGVNDEFRPRTTGVIKFNYLKIFNRYGKEIFLTNDVYKRWNGALNGIPEPVGTYFWVFSAVDLYRKKDYIKSGSVTILR
jgi:gliding motility-associated-like protein